MKNSLPCSKKNMGGIPNHRRAQATRSSTSTQQALGGKAIRKQVRYRSHSEQERSEGRSSGLHFGAVKPVPVILTINFNGNQAATDDPGIKLPVLWDRRTGKSGPATATSRGTDARWNRC